MKRIFVAALMCLLVGVSPAAAVGCLRGALVGGIIGHYAGHHGFLGAAAGCLYGRHQANEANRASRTVPPAGQSSRW
ncbi:MAG: hypothetical protein JO366_03225 [Methylobacteriaceae bacterium]|nr:hypothetical protein [Methylobacteriaceae bacterium]MBV9243804.1 hypothetical protein [Methylobacteriaceae bacterium]MBV9636988.1 hypothetical protein [Methylobacteriaceae bacterium]MBV9702485.1 hypothetical protein [Methylobacteriaceae bacterium]